MTKLNWDNCIPHNYMCITNLLINLKYADMVFSAWFAHDSVTSKFETCLTAIIGSNN